MIYSRLLQLSFDKWSMHCFFLVLVASLQVHFVSCHYWIWLDQIYLFPVAPFAKVVPQTVAVIEGGNITLVCNISGVPSPSVLWTQMGSTKVVSHKSSLTIVNVSRPGTPNNMIQYQCTASNGVEIPATATVNVTVHCKYSILINILLIKGLRVYLWTGENY